MRKTSKFLVWLLCFTAVVSAQDLKKEESKPVVDLLKAIKDAGKNPTTYVPATMFSYWMWRDWKSSQPAFHNGYVERNPDFTVDGLPYGNPVSYGRGNVNIAIETFEVLGISTVHNIANNLLTQALERRYPEHHKLLRVVSLIEKIGFAGDLTWSKSWAHYTQTRDNEDLIRGKGW